MGNRDHLVRFPRIHRILERIYKIRILDSPTQLRLEQIDTGSIYLEALFEPVSKIPRVQDQGTVAFLDEVCAYLIPSECTAAGKDEGGR